MVFGSPLHPLVAHAVVVCVPLAALSAILMAFWPAAARRLWPAVLFVATVALVAVPVTTDSGETLEGRVGESAIVEAHAKAGEQVLPFVIVLWLAVAGICASVQFAGRASPAPAEHGLLRARCRPARGRRRFPFSFPFPGARADRAAGCRLVCCDWDSCSPVKVP